MTIREFREYEKTRYFLANASKLPDCVERWRKYEDLILMRYGTRPVDEPHNYSREAALDQAWIRRDRG